MRLIVAGSRGFTDYPLMTAVLDQYVKSKQPQTLIVISGTARGADQLGEQWAKSRSHKVLRCPADWDRYGKSAGYRRNEEMAAMATDCIIFWNGQSKGSQHMFTIAQRHKLSPVLIVSKPKVTESRSHQDTWDQSMHNHTGPEYQI